MVTAAFHGVLNTTKVLRMGIENEAPCYLVSRTKVHINMACIPRVEAFSVSILAEIWRLHSEANSNYEILERNAEHHKVSELKSDYACIKYRLPQSAELS